MADIYVATTGNDTTGDGSSGSPYATAGKAGSVHSGGDTIWVKAGSYTITSASYNVAGGCVQLLQGGDGGYTRLLGYGTAPGDRLSRPVFTASGISTFTLVKLSNNFTYADNIAVDGASLTSSRGFELSAVAHGGYYLKASNCTNGGISGSGGACLVLCEVTGCSSVVAFAGGQMTDCVSHDNTVTGFDVGQACCAIRCLSYDNSGGSSDGFNTTRIGLVQGCIAYNNGRHGFSSVVSVNSLIDCIGYGNGGYGFNLSGAGLQILANCAGGSNTSGNIAAQVSTHPQIGFVTLTADPFVDTSTGDFNLNDAVGGGRTLRAVTYDLPGGGGTSVYPFIDLTVPPTKAQIAAAVWGFKERQLTA